MTQDAPTTIHLKDYRPASYVPGEIKGAADKTFTAKLDWRTANSACAIQGDAVSGKVTDKGIAWEFVTKSPCNTPYTAELNRGDKGWEGKVAAKDNSVVADIKADLAMASPLHTTGQPPEIILVNMGGNDCPPCVSWRMFELPKLQATEAFRSITFVHVEKSIKSTVPPPLLPPIGG